MKELAVELVKGGLGLLVEGVKAIRARRASKRRTATDILEEHGELRSTKAKERAHEALERRRGQP